MNYIDYCEFYITNVCNLACPGCNRFNNYKFTGFQRWDEYKDDYTKWSKELTFGSIAVLGGEPLLNPDFMKWVSGLRSLWPSAILRIISNGFQLPKVKGLYEHLLVSRKTQLWVGIHNKKHKSEIFNIVENFLTAPFKYEFNGDNKYQEYMTITDANGIRVRIEYNWWFHQGALIKQDNKLTLHTSDAEKAHANCHMKTCHHFIRGKLYKCGVVAVLPEFSQQHPLELTTDDRGLMQGYTPLSITDSAETKATFISNLPNAIPQCKFCPEAYKGDQIFAELK